jgi:hypothetical protein
LYSENILKDVNTVVKAILTNQIAKFAPSYYVSLTKQTGRGSESESPESIKKYFVECFDDYLKHLEVTKLSAETYFKNKVVLEYGPGNILGVALLLYANGAQRVDCVDRFPLNKNSSETDAVYTAILNTLEADKRSRAESAFKVTGDPLSGFREEAINYIVTPDGLSGAENRYDIVLSRAVLEHVNRLDKTFKDIKTALKNTGVSIHQVDLNSHGLDRYTKLDFLTWNRHIYWLMYSHKGYPNRYRIDYYKQLMEANQLTPVKLKPTKTVDQKDIELIRPHLDAQFKRVSNEDLSWLGFWMVLKKYKD